MRPSGVHLGLSTQGDSVAMYVQRSGGAPPSAGTMAIRPCPGSATRSGTKASHRPLGDTCPCQKLMPGCSSSMRTGLSVAPEAGHSHIGTALAAGRDTDMTMARPSGVQD